MAAPPSWGGCLGSGEMGPGDWEISEELSGEGGMGWKESRDAFWGLGID